jgi:hypothetical protein
MRLVPRVESLQVLATPLPELTTLLPVPATPEVAERVVSSQV